MLYRSLLLYSSLRLKIKCWPFQVKYISFISFINKYAGYKYCREDAQYFCGRFRRAHVAEVSGTAVRITYRVMFAVENTAGITSVGAASCKDWLGNIFKGVMCRYGGFEASLKPFWASDFLTIFVAAFPRSGIFTMVAFQAVNCARK